MHLTRHIASLSSSERFRITQFLNSRNLLWFGLSNLRGGGGRIRLARDYPRYESEGLVGFSMETLPPLLGRLLRQCQICEQEISA